jgi:hypothetical protein
LDNPRILHLADSFDCYSPAQFAPPEALLS